MKTRNILIILFSVLPIPVALYHWEAIPAMMPVHFGLRGMPDMHWSREIAVFVFPAISFIGVSIFWLFGHRIKSGVIAKFHWAFVCVMAFFSFVATLIIIKSFKPELDVLWCLVIGLNCLVGVLSWIMRDVEQNRIFGVRNRWTFKSTKVWDKTHSCVAKLGIVFSLVNIVSLFFLSSSSALVMTLAIFLLWALFSCFISWRYFKMLSVIVFLVFSGFGTIGVLAALNSENKNMLESKNG